MTAPMEIRLLDERDRKATLDFLLAQDADSLYARFAQPMKREAVQSYFDAVIGPALACPGKLARGVEVHAVGAFDRAGQLEAIAEVHLYETPAGLLAEASFIIETGFRAHGLGKLLLAACHGVARHRGAAHFKVITQPSNTAMRRLATRMHLTPFNDGESDWCAQRPIEQDEAGSIPSLISLPGLLPRDLGFSS